MRERIDAARILAGACFTALLTVSPLFPEPAFADGAWKNRTEVVWSSETRGLIRKEFRVWDPHPELDLEFLWEPRAPVRSDENPLANGAGTLSWRAKGAPDYDRQFIYSVFKGTLKDGRPEGDGALLVFRTGYSYSGHWLNGLMDGHGVLKLENGDRYDGDFVAGKMEGEGRYVSSDGSIYQGKFQSGLRHGRGKLLLAEGSYWTVWDQGTETNRVRIPDVTPIPRALKPRLAAVSNAVKLKLAMDEEKNGTFADADPDTQAHVYDAEFSPGMMTIQPGSKAFRDAWKGGGKISSGYEDGLPSIYSDNQFASVFLKVQVQNEGVQPAVIADAILDVASSTLDPEPYLEASQTGPGYCGIDTAYRPDIIFRNLGWGQVVGAKLTYSLGTADRRTQETTAQLGSFDGTKQASIVDGLRGFGVDTDRLKKAALDLYRQKMSDKPKTGGLAFRCDMPSGDTTEDQINTALAACVLKVKKTGLFGRLGDFVYPQQNVIFTTMSGNIEYQWKSNQGELKSKSSPFSLNIPLVSFDIEMGEAGCDDAVDRGSRVQTSPSLLSVGRSSYQVHLPKNWQASIAQGTARSFNLDISAPKTSRHQFQLVLKLTDGSVVTSPVVDLTYFRPRMPKP
ncbi:MULTISPECIES: MORN repeat-containing protein [unclassified Bradyrhizobium]|uniref:MORN repeat-containing protein n=1 Tax=unclassified Bradyrhizobium TaxID=2631580 RepID=UPI000415ACBE|nr:MULTISPECIES: hypothetical protein [unclassified Bradyrhizobium]QIG91130.1 hypothetical protein G6P99_00450 [Bradyrhizobium sp. 6(2017)]